MKKILVCLLALLLAACPAMADAVDSPAETAEAGLSYLNKDMNMSFRIERSGWTVELHGGDPYRVDIYSPNGNPNNLISVSSYIDETYDSSQFDALQQESYKWSAGVLMDLGLLTESSSGEISVGEGDLYKGYRYDGKLQAEDEQCPFSYLYWTTENRFYTCTVSAMSEDEEEVYGVLDDILRSFCLIDEADAQPDERETLTMSEAGDAFLYRDPFADLCVYVNSSSWRLEKSKDNPQRVAFYDSEGAESSLILVSSQAVTGYTDEDFDALHRQAFEYIESRLNENGRYTAKTQEAISLGGALCEDTYSGYWYDGTWETEQGTLRLTYVYWMVNNRFYQCSASALPEEEASVYAVLDDILHSFCLASAYEG